MTLGRGVQIHTTAQHQELCKVLASTEFDSTIRIFNEMSYIIVVRNRARIVEIDSTGESTTYLRRQ